jgi:beta-phosphoglucomutase-like phosphatase (HAD superfamily)/dTDP-glucose pyrophosphorylase
MIKAILFDFDNTLISMAEAHYQTLNKALEEVAGKQFIIEREEHNKTYNGLSTKTKLDLLIKNKGLPTEHLPKISEAKQKYTIDAINSLITENKTLQQDLQKLKDESYQLYCVSNARYETVELGLKKLGIFDIFDKVWGNESIKKQKPSSNCYLQAFVYAGLDPKECLIVEDSAHGRMSAIRSGAHLCTVDRELDTTYEHIKKSIDKANTKPSNIKWTDSKLTVVIPMSGRGSRFTQELGYKVPKPLISINGKPMIQLVVENLNVEAEFIFIVQKAHYEQYNLQTLLSLIAPDCKIIQVDGITEGAACSVLLAKEYINNDNHLFIINSDQYIEWNSSDFFNKMLTTNCDGGIICFNKENDKKWSYVKLDESGYIIDVKEKQPISNLATIGAYFYNRGKYFVSAAEEMIANNDRTNNEFYVAPVYNYMIKNNKKIIPYEILSKHFWGLGTPEDLEYFLKSFKR